MKSIIRRKALENKEVFRGIKIKNTKVSIEKVKILNAVDAEIKVYEELIKPSDEFKKYDSERMEIIKKYAEKDENGEVKTFEGGVFKINENTEEFKKEIEKLEETHKETLEEKTKADLEIKEWLDSSITTSDGFLYSEIVIKVEELPTTLTDDDIKAIEVYAEIK